MSSGLSFFPLEVNLDGKVRLIEAEFGIKGFGVIVKLWQRIYGDCGYYLEWTKDVGLLFSSEIGEGYDLVSEIVAASVRRGIFDQNLFDKYCILTSRGIQQRYLDAVGRRKKVEVKAQYLLVNDVQNYKNVSISAENVDISAKNDDISAQKKRNEMKRNEKRVWPSGDGRAGSDALFNQFWAEYPRKVKKQDAIKAWKKLKAADSLLVDILAGLAAWKKCEQWTKDGVKFVPYPATFLNARQWEEVPEDAATGDAADALMAKYLAEGETLDG